MANKTDEKKMTSKYGIVNMIMKDRKLGDDGTLEKFFDKQVKHLKREIKIRDQNIDASTTNYENKEDELLDELEDAKEALTDAYKDVDPDKIKNNANINAFEEEYWTKINRLKNSISTIEYSLKVHKAYYTSTIENYEKEIEELTQKINLIKNFK